MIQVEANLIEGKKKKLLKAIILASISDLCDRINEETHLRWALKVSASLRTKPASHPSLTGNQQNQQSLSLFQDDWWGYYKS